MFDWENEGPGPRALEAFRLAQSEDEFPQSYSGQSWRAAYRIWQVVKDNPAVLIAGPYDNIPGVKTDDLGLSGFMYGWAVNAVRQMIGFPAGGNPAIVTLGVGNQTYPSVGPAEKAMKRAIGGSDD